MAERSVSRSFVHVSSDADGIRVEVPDVVPTLEPFLASLGWHGHPTYSDTLDLGEARWPTLRQVGLPHLGPTWRQLPPARLWAAHAVAMARWRKGQTSPGSPTLLDLKVELARRESSPCRLCALRCLARRQEGERGLCGAGHQSRVFSFQVLSAEEPWLGRGAAARLSGCNANCTYCSRPDGIPSLAGREAAPEQVRDWLESQAESVEAIHWIGGNVDQELPFILEVMAGLLSPLPVIWNHNATATPEVAIPLLDGVVDVYLPDLRYGSGPCAARTGADVMNFANATACIEAELRQDAQVIVRHLALPGHIDCCSRPVLEWLSRYRDRVFLSLMGCGYMPLRFAMEDIQLGRSLNQAEHATLEALVNSFRLRRVS